MERLIDDFVFFSFLVGNDFLPQIFCMNTKMGTYDQFLRVLRRFYEKQRGYLTDNGSIDQKGLTRLVKYLKELEEKLIETTLGDFIKKLKEIRSQSVYKALIMQDAFGMNESYEESMIHDTEFVTLEDFQQFLNKQSEEKAQADQEITQFIEEEDDLE